MFRMNLLLLILILSNSYSIAQAPDTLWTKTFGGIQAMIMAGH